LKLLNYHNVKYLLIGGYAVAYHGYPRATADIDIWVERKTENADNLIRVLKEFGFSDEDITRDLFLGEAKIIRMGVPPLRIELLTSISGLLFSDCYKHRIVDTIDGVKLDIISLEDLKRNKKASGRHKDLADLDHL
jgi:predicted nucleotidyltransferase